MELLINKLMRETSKLTEVIVAARSNTAREIYTKPKVSGAQNLVAGFPAPNLMPLFRPSINKFFCSNSRFMTFLKHYLCA